MEVCNICGSPEIEYSDKENDVALCSKHNKQSELLINSLTACDRCGDLVSDLKEHQSWCMIKQPSTEAVK